ncbi:MAG: hypothetical protein RL021_1738 [Bacteroidota bacterium]|jgi:23S rRNA pseudouridine1911/1915/1917 synthase
MLADRILYEDNHLVAVNKLPGEIVQGDKTGDEPLSGTVKRYIKDKYNKPGEVFLGVVHRLDRPVSGVVVFARTSKALARMNDLFRERKTEKTYWAVVQNKPEQTSGSLVNFLWKNESQNKSYVTEEGRAGASRSWLDYRLIAASDRYFLLEVKPQTGRHHQIRVQLSHMGCPIKGDLKYGADRSNEDGSIHLHARRLNFIHPVSHQAVEIVAPVPEEKLWKFFEEKAEQE